MYVEEYDAKATKRANERTAGLERFERVKKRAQGGRKEGRETKGRIFEGSLGRKGREENKKKRQKDALLKR